MAVPKPESLPRWAEGTIQNDPVSNQPNVIEPTSAQAEHGYSYDSYPGRQFFNWLGRIVSRWTAWFDQQEEAHGAAISSHEIAISTQAQAIIACTATANAASAKNVLQDDEIEELNVKVDAFGAFIGMPLGAVVPYFGSPTTLIAATEDWLICDGALYDETVYTELFAHFSAVGKTEPKRTPNLSGRVPVGVGGYVDDSGTYNYALGAEGGEAGVVLNDEHIPPLKGVYSGKATDDGAYGLEHLSYKDKATTAHENRAPFLGLNYIIKAR